MFFLYIFTALHCWSF